MYIIHATVHQGSTSLCPPLPALASFPLTPLLSLPVISIKAQATTLELLDGAGLSGLCPLMATEMDAERRLGDVLAEAVKVSRCPHYLSSHHNLSLIGRCESLRSNL